MQLEICPICQVNKPEIGNRYCPDCLQLIEDKVPWALAMREIDQDSINETRRMTRPHKAAPKGFTTYDPTPERLTKRDPDHLDSFIQTDMNDYIDSIEDAMGTTFPPGFLDMVEKYDPAIKYIREVLDSKPSERVHTSMLAQLVVIMANYWAHEPELAKQQEGWGVTDENYQLFYDNTTKPHWHLDLLNGHFEKQGKQLITYRTFKEYLKTAKNTLRDYENKRKAALNAQRFGS